MGVMKRLYHLRHLGRVDEPRWSRPPRPVPPGDVPARRRMTRAERAYKRSKRVQMQMFEEDEEIPRNS